MNTLRSLSLILALNSLAASPLVSAATYNPPIGVTGEGSIMLSNVGFLNLIGTSGGSVAGVLRALDNLPIYGGQVYQLESIGAASGLQDASFTTIDGKLIIPSLVESEQVSHNVILLKTSDQPLQFTVGGLSATSTVDGAITKVIFYQGPKGDKGETGASGVKGDKGDKGEDGAKGDTGLAGANGLTTSVNNIQQVNGNITLTKNDIGLGNVDNSADLDKPISNATQSALDLKANLNSPALTGTPTAPTAAINDNSTKLATTAYVDRVSGVHQLGESYGGGIVYYVYDGGRHGLIAATSDQSSSVPWDYHSDSIPVTRAKADGVGAGKGNTTVIVTILQSFSGSFSYSSSQNSAASLCNEYKVNDQGVLYGDWYLPSKEELHLLYLQKSLPGLNLSNGEYWSSTEDFVDTPFQNNAWAEDFSQANASPFSKAKQDIQRSMQPTTGYARAIRAF